MGNRALYVVVEDNSWRRYYSHWGAVSIAAQLLGGPSPALRFIRAQEPFDGWLDDGWCEGAALVDTIADVDGGVRAYRCGEAGADHVLLCGQAVLATLPSARPPYRYPHLPCAGVHLDVARRSAGVWTIDPLQGTREAAAPYWPDWRLESWGSGRDRQLTRCGEAIDLPPVDLGTGLDAVQRDLEHYLAFDADALVSFALAEPGPPHTTAVVNPLLSTHVRVPPDEADLRRIATAIAEIRHAGSQRSHTAE